MTSHLVRDGTPKQQLGNRAKYMLVLTRGSNKINQWVLPCIYCYGSARMVDFKNGILRISGEVL